MPDSGMVILIRTMLVLSKRSDAIACFAPEAARRGIVSSASAKARTRKVKGTKFREGQLILRMVIKMIRPERGHSAQPCSPENRFHPATSLEQSG